MGYVVGIDPGSRVTGFCALDLDRPRAQQVVELEAIQIVGRTIEDRLENAGAKLTQRLGQFMPKVAAVEDGYVGENAKSALTIGEFRGVAIFVAAKASAAVHRVAAVTARKVLAIRQGQREFVKQQVVMAVTHYFGLRYAPPEDAADAAVLALWAAGQTAAVPFSTDVGAKVGGGPPPF